MKFAVVGQLRNALPLLQQIHRSDKDELAASHLAGELLNAVAGSKIPFRLESSAESAILAHGVDVVVLAVDTAEQSLQLARSALQADRHVIVYAPPDASTAFGFELHLLFDEAQHAVVPITGRMRLRALALDCTQLNSATAAVPPDHQPLVQQLDLDLELHESGRTAVRDLQLVALDAVAAIGLRYTQITALDSTAPDGTLISRRLILGASTVSEQALPPATITIRIRPAAPARTEVACTSAKSACLQHVTAGGVTRSDELQGADAPLLDRVRYLCESRGRCVPWLEAFSSSLELADAAEKSLRRRRTVDVYFDSGSERSVFKSHMTAIGCGVLTWMMFGMVGFLVLAKLASLPPAVLQIARALWIAPIIVFLIVQFLLPLTRSRDSTRK